MPCESRGGDVGRKRLFGNDRGRGLGTRLSDESFVCAREDGLPLQPDSFTHDWDRKIATTKLPRIRFHDLRHAHATHMLASGVHPKVASERLGHSKIGITLDLYSHVLPNMQADAAAIVDDALRAALNKRETKGSKMVAASDFASSYHFRNADRFAGLAQW